MLIDFFLELRKGGVPATIKEFLTLMEALRKHVISGSIDDYYYVRNLDDTVELGTRNIKVALRRLRRFARTGAPEELDMDDTIRSTA